MVLTNLQRTHLGQYSVVVSNFIGSTTSQMAGLGLYITLAPRFDPALSISEWVGGTTVRWQEIGPLERALSVKGPWQSLSAASPFTNSPTGAMAFFRLKHPKIRESFRSPNCSSLVRSIVLSGEKPNEASVHSGQSAFATTCWSVVLAAGEAGSATAEEALAQLCRSYWR